MTPHAAFDSVEAIEDLQRRSAQHILQALTGEPPSQLVNPSVLTQANCRL